MQETFRYINYYRQVEYRIKPTMLFHNDKGPALIDMSGECGWFVEGYETRWIKANGEVETKTLSMDRFGNVKRRK